ncbi:MAG: ArgR family transcriptional regulator [Streptococcaceae bacterium]|jgi:transcriptional regulator of arginine metabolism|nr:ArgR family transcriptional regulator [Streptococcaceae bacterium]
MKREERRKLLIQLIETIEIKRQEDLVEFFRARGHEVTQATISRDIRDLGLVKLAATNGNFRYAKATETQGVEQILLSKSLKSVAVQGNFVRLDVAPGSAMRLKKNLLVRFESEIFSVLADDDTVLVVAVDTAAATKIQDELVN